MDHGLDQRFRMDCPRCIRRPAWEPAHCGNHIFHAPELRAATVASVFDLYCLQSRGVFAQCFRQFTASLCNERGFCVVHHWICYHFHHRPGMLVSKLRKWQVCVRHLYKWYAKIRVVPSIPLPDFDLENLSAAYTCIFFLLFVLILSPVLERQWAHSDTCADSGWPDGIGWLLGLLQAGLGLTGFDAVAHMIGMYHRPRDLPTLLTNDDRGNPKSTGGGATNHDSYRLDWYLYGVHLPGEHFL